MILGNIIGKTTTSKFTFEVKNECLKHEFIQVFHKNYDWVLCQIQELEKTNESTLAFCRIIGYLDTNKKLKSIKYPFEIGTEVLMAEDNLVKEIFSLETEENAALLGKLEGKDIDIHLDLNKLLTKHISILAKSGAGKSYTVGVLLEEIIEKKVPLLIIDPHGEYSTLKLPNDNQKELEKLQLYNLSSTAFTNIKEFGDNKLNPELIPLKLPGKFKKQELIHLLPKLSSNQLGLLYSAIKEQDSFDLDQVLLSLDLEESNSKYNLINMIETLKQTNIFSNAPVAYNELIKPSQTSIINLKGISQEIQEIIVFKLCQDLFMLRKQNKIPPFFLVIEECHNFCPERNYGEKKPSQLIRNIASEGRKFGLGLGVISQRPARVDKSVLSQCTTQIILKTTNPNDLKSIISSVEGIDSNSEDDIQNLPIGSALVTGVVDIPLYVNIRPRRTKHGGTAVNILQYSAENKVYVLEEEKEPNVLSQVKEFEQELIPVIMPNISKQDFEIMADEKDKVKTTLIPATILTCKEQDKDYKILIEKINGNVISNIDTLETKQLPQFDKLTKKEIKILQLGFSLKEFKEIDLIKEIGSNFGIKDSINNLLRLKYLKQNLEKYSLTNNYILSKLSYHSTIKSPDYKNIQYNSKLEEKLNLDKIKEMYEKFTDITETQDCFIVKYEI
jgi:DNA helicase HerA-like ATPase